MSKIVSKKTQFSTYHKSILEKHWGFGSGKPIDLGNSYSAAPANS